MLPLYPDSITTQPSYYWCTASLNSRATSVPDCCDKVIDRIIFDREEVGKCGHEQGTENVWIHSIVAIIDS